jgi:hypothetical protein
MALPALTTRPRTDSRASLGRRVLHGLGVIRAAQHPNGEIISFRRDREGNYQYCRSPFASAHVHDALACFDVTSRFFDEGCLELIPDDAADTFTEAVAEVRRGIRGFLAWQEEPAGWWRFLGRQSSLDPDVCTTTNAAIALMDQNEGSRPARAAERADTVERFRSAEGLYYTFLRPGHGGYGWMDEAGRPVVGFDRVVNADCLRYRGLLGLQKQPETQRVAEHLLDVLAHADLRTGTALFPSPVVFLFAIAQAWRQGQLPGLEALREQLAPRLLGLQDEHGSFGGPLSTALGVMALADLAEAGEPLGRAVRALVRQMRPEGGWSYEDFVVSGFGSPALSTALGLAALARGHALTGGEL